MGTTKLQKIKILSSIKKINKLKKNEMMIAADYDSPLEAETYTLQEVDMEMAELEQEVYIPPTQIKRERASPYPTVPRRRPGRTPTVDDNALSPQEYDRLQRRRERNRHAAARCRERRLTKISDLEGKVSDLAAEKTKLQIDNNSLQQEIEKLKFQLSLQVGNEPEMEPEMEPEILPVTASNVVDEYEQFPAVRQLENLAVGTPKTAVLFTPGGTFSLTPLQCETVFNFPILGGDAPKVLVKGDETEQFKRTLAIL